VNCELLGLMENTRSHILIVDDKPDNLRLLGDILKGMGFKVRPAINGQIAIHSAISTPPDLILMDILMPEMDGYETCRQLKADPTTKDIPLIFISALGGSIDKVKAFKAGGVDYVNKPFNKDELLARITTHLALRHAHKHMEESEKRFAAVMNSMDSVMYAADMETYELLFVNQYTRDAFGATKGDICWLALQKSQTGPCEFCTNKYLVKNGESTGVYTWDFKNTQNGRWYHIHNRAIHWPDGRLVRTEIATDITVLKQTEAALKTAKESAEIASRAKSTFLSHMSHELRTPLNSILGYARLLKRDVSAEKTREFDIIEQSGQHLLSLINDLLDLAKTEAGKIDLVLTDFNLAGFLENLADIIRIRCELKGIGFQMILSDHLSCMIRADEIRLRQVLLNLLGNAVKFTSDGEIGLQVEHLEISDDHVRFKVTDTGVGILKADLDTIFDPFQQAGDPKMNVKGTGLGLNLSKYLVDLMGGELRVESKPGSGSTFWFDLNLAAVNKNAGGNGIKSGSIHVEPVADTESAARSSAFTLPPENEIQKLINLTDMGDMASFCKRLEQLARKDDQFSPFVHRLQHLVDGFDIEAIRKLLREFS